MGDIKFSPNTDIGVTNLHDIVPERMVKLYPYEMPNTTDSEEFIGQQTISVVNISQANLDQKDELLKQDDDGKYYFEAFTSITSNTVLDVSSSTSTFGQELKEEDSFNCLSNWYYEGELEDIKIGSARLLPAIFTVGKPFSQGDYDSGTQQVFVSSTMIEAIEGNEQYSNTELDTEGLYEFQLANVTLLEANFTNAKILFAEDYKQEFNSTDNVMTISLNSGALLSHVKAYGTYNKIAGGITKQGYFDLFTSSPLTPIKATPTAVQDNIELYMDWFNYDNVMPWAYADKFIPNGKISSIIGNTEDVKLIHDMLYVTAAFADNFTNAPRYTASEATGAGGGAKEGDIKGDSKVANTDLKYVAIVNKEPMKVVDTLFETHLRNYPDYAISDTRQRNVKMILSALSRYISSSYAIAKGQNSFNQIYLPWYLELSDKIDYVNPVPDLFFTLRTNYFKSNFNSSDDFSKGEDLILPPNFNISNQVYLKSETMVSLPELPYTINEISKLQLAGDIDSKTDIDLRYLFYAPITKLEDAAKMYVNSTDAIASSAKTDTANYAGWIIKNVDTYTGVQAISHIEAQYPGWEPISTPTITKSQANENIIETAKIATSQITLNPNIPNEKIYNYVWSDGKNAGSSRGTSPKIPTRTVNKLVNVFVISSGQRIKTTSGSITNYSIDKRRLNYNKEEWNDFINNYNLVGDSNNLNIDKSPDIKVIGIDEIIIGQIWGDNIGLTIGTSHIINIELFNKTDETIGTQRIIFT